MDCSQKHPSGEVATFSIDHRIEAGWPNARSSNGVGHAPGGWAKGAYHVSCAYKGRVLAERDFTVN